MISLESYQYQFSQKFTPWLEERWGENNFFHSWVDLPAFLQESTHGLTHSAKVRAVAYKITQEYLDNITEQVDEDFIDMMALFHDIARHVKFPVDREDTVINKNGLTKKQQRVRRSIFPHELTGAAIAQIVCSRDLYFRELVTRKGRGIFRQLLSHDYHSPAITPYCMAPESLEAQVFCVADKTSIDPLKEVMRRYNYLTNRPDKAVPFLDSTFPIEARRMWNFQQDARDALCAIIPIFSFYPIFTSSPGLKRYYEEWSTNLVEAAKATIAVAKTQGGPEMEESVTNLLKSFNIR